MSSNPGSLGKAVLFGWVGVGEVTVRCRPKRPLRHDGPEGESATTAAFRCRFSVVHRKRALDLLRSG